MKVITRSIAVLLALCLAAGCSRPAEKKPPLRLALDVWPGYAIAFLAREKGFFRENGVDVELVLKNEYIDSKKLYEYGDVDGVFCVYADVFTLNADGIPTKAVYICDYSEEGDVIIGRPGISSLSELKGKKVGISQVNGFSHIFVLKALVGAGGLKEEDIRLKRVSAHECLAALERGEIDAGHTWEPTRSEAVRKGYKVLCEAGRFPLLIVDVLGFRDDVIKDRPDDVRRVVAALARAADYLAQNRDEALGIMSRAMGMEKTEMDAGFKGIKVPDIHENARAMSRDGNGKTLYGSAALIGDFYARRGLLPRPLDYGDLADPAFVEDAERGKDALK